MKPVTAAHRSHVPRLVQSHHLRVQIHGGGSVGRFNAGAARIITNVLSSMWFFYFCVVLDIVELPQVIAAHSVVLWVGYISTVVIQLLALPALGANQRLASALQDAQAEATHETLTALHAMNARQLEILELMQGKPK